MTARTLLAGGHAPRGLSHRPTLARSGMDNVSPDQLLLMQRALGNRVFSGLLQSAAHGHAMHAPASVLRTSVIQRCGPTPCDCSAEKRAAYDARFAKETPPQCGVSSEDEMGGDAVQQVANAGENDEESPEKAERAAWMPRPIELSSMGLPRPHAGGAATIVCDGKGGYRVALNDWAGAPCGTENCVKKHEQSHAADWKKRWPKGCQPKADHPDGSDIPLGGDGYADFLKKSECKAHTVDLKCADTLLKGAKGDCKAKVKAYRDLTKEQKAGYC